MIYSPGDITRAVDADLKAYRLTKQQPPQHTGTATPKMRTQAEIIAQLEARYAELEREAESPAIRWPCKSCRWADDWKSAWCHNPLVKGFGRKVHMGSARIDRDKTIPSLCGPEKALWEPRLTWWQRIAEWIAPNLPAEAPHSAKSEK